MSQSLRSLFPVAFLLAGSILHGHAAQAASFDCRKATTARERMICADPELSKLDETLDATYRADLSKLDEVGATSIRSDQQLWLKSLDVPCLPVEGAGEGIRACLHFRYSERVYRLRHAVLRNEDDTMIYYVDRSVPGQFDWYGPNRVYESYVLHYPQIDRPNAAELAWNERVAKVPDPNLSCRGQARMTAMYDVDIDVIHRGFVWATVSSGVFSCTGGGVDRPSFEHRVSRSVTVLGLDLRPASPEDVFRQDRVGARSLTGLSSRTSGNSVTRTIATHPGFLSRSSTPRRAIRRSGSSPTVTAPSKVCSSIFLAMITGAATGSGSTVRG